MKKLIIFIAINLAVFFGLLLMTGQAGAEDCITKENSIFYPGNSYDLHSKQFYLRICPWSDFHGNKWNKIRKRYEEWVDMGAYWECLDDVNRKFPIPTLSEEEKQKIINCGKEAP